MCGIVGLIDYYSTCSQKDLLVKMNDAIQHRGPDGYGYHNHENVYLGHRRLSIIDLNTGQQPLCNEDSSIWITFNGEIYNFVEMQRDLLQKGHRFKTKSDTEVIVHAYEQWGVDCIKHFRGMFAFAIHDIKKQLLFLARDHFGIKPLYYCFTNQFFAFASELEALKQIPDVSKEPDLQAVDEYLKLWYIPAPKTGYKQIRKLPPAHYMIVDLQRNCAIKEYWQMEFKPNYHISLPDWIDRVDSAIKESVQAHLLSDVPLGVLLSGGVDSSSVVAYMSQKKSNPVKTFNITFKEKDFDESPYARHVSRLFHTKHYEELVEPDALSLLPMLVKHYGEPYADSSAIPTYYVCKTARKHVTVALSGDGADEMFGGYAHFVKWVKDHYKNLPKLVLYYLSTFLYLPFFNELTGRSTNMQNWYKYAQYTDKLSSSLWKPEFKNNYNKTIPIFEKEYQRCNSFSLGHITQYMTAKTFLPYDILTKVDVASMISSLEVRPPYCDTRLFDVASQVPARYNITPYLDTNYFEFFWNGKVLLKKVMGKYFSKNFLHRPKMGFCVPIEKWFKDDKLYNKVVQERLQSPHSNLSRYFVADKLKGIISRKNSGDIWCLLFLEEWLSQSNQG